VKQGTSFRLILANEKNLFFRDISPVPPLRVAAVVTSLSVSPIGGSNVPRATSVDRGERGTQHVFVTLFVILVELFASTRSSNFAANSKNSKSFI
jgi:hypothetical protein